MQKLYLVSLQIGKSQANELNSKGYSDISAKDIRLTNIQ
jgi:hypothetical protein